MPFQVRTNRCLAAALAGLALAAPAARAESYQFPPGISEQEKQVLASRGLAAPAPPLKADLRAPNTPAADDAFDWTSAGAVGGLLVLTAGLGLTRRARVSSRPRPS